jgi:multimeric flavodoxin WrbA
MSQKTVLAVNGSPRRKGNTAELLHRILEGAQAAGAATELVNLYDLDFKGCISCFSCKRKDRPHGVCAMKDGLSPVLERIREVDAVAFGSPVYFMNVASGFFAFCERLFFSNYLYSAEIPTVFPKKMPSAFVCTMNMTEAQYAQFSMDTRIGFLEMAMTQHFRVPPRRLFAFDTYQFKDYAKYESSIFSEPHKAAWRSENWPVLLEQAFALGQELVQWQDEPER